LIGGNEECGVACGRSVSFFWKKGKGKSGGPGFCAVGFRELWGVDGGEEGMRRKKEMGRRLELPDSVSRS
jgi:hypothetical protein